MERNQALRRSITSFPMSHRPPSAPPQQPTSIVFFCEGKAGNEAFTHCGSILQTCKCTYTSLNHRRHNSVSCRLPYADGRRTANSISAVVGETVLSDAPHLIYFSRIAYYLLLLFALHYPLLFSAAIMMQILPWRSTKFTLSVFAGADKCRMQTEAAPVDGQKGRRGRRFFFMEVRFKKNKLPRVSMHISNYFLKLLQTEHLNLFL